MFFLLFILLYIGTHILMYYGYYRKLGPAFFGRSRLLLILTTMALILLALTPLLSHFILAIAVRRPLVTLGNYYLMGIIYFFPVFFLVRFILKYINFSGEKLNFIIAISIIVGLLGYGTYRAKDLKLTSYEINRGSRTEDEIKIALITDLHLGSNISLEQIQKLVEEINRAKVDLVVFGGDIFDSTTALIDRPDKTSEELGKIKSTYGSYGVWGNHDIEELLVGGFSASSKANAFRSEEMVEFMKKSKVKMIEDSYVDIGNRLRLVGRLDKSKSGYGLRKRKEIEKILGPGSDGKSLVVLDHSPVDFKRLNDSGVDLILSGHTHGGQFFPLNLTQHLLWKNPYGYKRYKKLQTIVSSGVGVYGPPIRLGSKAEFCLIQYRY